MQATEVTPLENYGKEAITAGMLDEAGTVREILLGVKRAGADLIITYHASDVARWLDEGRWPD